jgi:hypothetical protein
MMSEGRHILELRQATGKGVHFCVWREKEQIEQIEDRTS